MGSLVQNKYKSLICSNKCINFVAKDSNELQTFQVAMAKRFRSGSNGKESVCNRDLGSISGLGKTPAGGHDNPLQYSCLENPHGQRNLVGYNPWGHKESYITEQLSTDERRVWFCWTVFLCEYESFLCMTE